MFSDPQCKNKGSICKSSTVESAFLSNEAVLLELKKYIFDIF